MHIEPGLVHESKIVLSYATAAAAGSYAVWLARKDYRLEQAPLLALQSLIAAVFVFIFFEVLPHFSAGVSEVHFIFGSTLFLILGAAPAAFGLALGLLAQGVFMSPTDLPQFGMNLTTLLVPLFAVSALARQIIPSDTPYVQMSYKQMLSLSAVYQAGIVAWVAFWVLYGTGATVENGQSITQFAVSYMPVILIEPIVDVAVLWLAKTMTSSSLTSVLSPRVNHAVS